MKCTPRYAAAVVAALATVSFFLSAAGSLSAEPAGSAPDIPYRIFILHSYEETNVCGQPQHAGVIAALRDAGIVEGEKALVRVFYMDTKRKNNTPEMMEEQGRLAMEQMHSFQPHVLVTLDDDAFRTVALKFVDTPVRIVFSGMNAQPEDYNKTKFFCASRSGPGHNVTGVYEKLHIFDAIGVHARLFPGLKKVRGFSDLSTTGRAISKQIDLELEHESLPCAWEMVVAKNWEEYREEVLKTNNDPDVGAIYPVALLLKDSAGKTYTAPEIFAWTIGNSSKPEIALNYAFTKMGLFGGAAVDFYSMGYQAGKMVVRILQGENPGDIPMEDALKYALVFNLDRAKQLGIEIPTDILMSADEVIHENDREKK